MGFVIRRPWTSVLIGWLVLLAGYLATQAHALFYDWADAQGTPFPIASRIEIAAGGFPFQNRSLQIGCSERGAHLVLRARLPDHADMRRPRPNRTAYSGETDSIVFLLHRTAGPLDAASLGARFWTDALARHDGPDTVTTEALDASQRDALVDWLAGSQDRRVSAFVHETMTTLTAKRDIADAAAALLAVCVAGAAR